MWRQASLQLLRNARPRGGHGWPGGSFWSEGTQTGRNGYLFGETPPAPGTARKWESWEFMTYFGFGTAAMMTYLVANGPDTSLQAWARPYAAKELKEEDEIFARYESDPEFCAEVTEKLRAHGKAPERYYDGVMMRNEFAVLKAKHAAGSS